MDGRLQEIAATMPHSAADPHLYANPSLTHNLTSSNPASIIHQVRGEIINPKTRPHHTPANHGTDSSEGSQNSHTNASQDAGGAK